MSRALRDAARKVSVNATRRAADRLGYDTVWRDHYSPIPDLRKLDDAWWADPSKLVGVTMDLAAQECWLEELAPYLTAFRPPRHARTPQEYGWENSGFGAVDAAVLFATIRHVRPKRILEIGAGLSTLVAAFACRANAADGFPAELVTADPFPQDFLDPLPHGVDRLIALGAKELRPDLFARLGAGDILFIDTTHTVKIGSEVNHLVLDVLPRLAKGVCVHIHDVFLPYEYPRRWIEDAGYFWSEQYLLQAFLIENPAWEILFGAHAMARKNPHRMGELVEGFDPAATGSFWMRRASEPCSA